MISLQKYLLSETNLTAIVEAFWIGQQLSTQSTGFLTLIIAPFLILQVLSNNYKPLSILRKIASSIVIGITIFLSVARIPFYEQFHSSFNQMIFTAIHEDFYALYISLIHGFNLFPRIIAVLIITVITIYIYEKFTDWNISPLDKLMNSHKFSSLIIIFSITILLSNISVNGGGLTWKTGLNWENAGVTKDNLLNESILDEYEAIYRAYRTQSRMLSSTGLAFTPEEIEKLAQDLTHQDGKNNLKIYLEKKAQGPQIPKPDHIFIILSESYANWPFLDEYKNLPITQHMKKLFNEKNFYYSGKILPAGTSTVGALMTMTTGLANANLYLTTMPVSLEKPYLTAIAPQFQRLGYHTNFWYAGPNTWENIQKFTLAQGFQNFYGRGNFVANATGNVWGIDDEYLYEEVIKKTSSTPSFNILLNTSNHSPFTLDLDSKKYPREEIIKNLPKDKQNDEELIKELGHFWYADRELYNFINKMQQKFPNSLFIIMGDHADRYNVEDTPSPYVRYAIPLIIIGKGISPTIFPKDAAGSQLDIAPTIIELIAPKGFNYYSIGQSLKFNKLGVNYGFWISNNAMGRTTELLNNPDIIEKGSLPSKERLENYINAVRAISWYLGSTNNNIIK